MVKTNNKISITLLGSPQSIKQPKIVVDKDGKERYYDPQKQLKMSDRLLLRSQMSDNGIIRAFSGPLKVKMTFHMGGAKSTQDASRRGTPYDKKCNVESMKEYYISIMKGIAFELENQLVDVVCEKVYSESKKTDLNISEI